MQCDEGREEAISGVGILDRGAERIFAAGQRVVIAGRELRRETPGKVVRPVVLLSLRDQERRQEVIDTGGRRDTRLGVAGTPTG